MAATRPAGVARVAYAGLSDPALAARILAGDHNAFRHLMGCCNQRLFRVARGILSTDHEAEDVVQEGWVRGYERLAGYRGEASLRTWFTRIVINLARQRLRERRPTVELDALAAPSATIVPMPGCAAPEDPSMGAARAELGRLIEIAVADLPADLRVVYILRDIEECSVEETAAQLDVSSDVVNTRLHRARRLLRHSLEREVAACLTDAFQFLGARCTRTTERVLARILTL